jgi:hypothetical protein
MAFSRVRVLHILLLALIAGVAMVPAGCAPEPGVTKYDVPKVTDTGANVDPASAKYRLLGAMFPADNPEWFFKFSGPTEDVTKYEKEFDELLVSVKLNGAAPLEFTPPKGWKKGPGRGEFVIATALTPDDKYEVTITSSRGGVEGNLGRWVGQIGLRPGANDVMKYTKPIETTGKVKGLRVDLKGPNDPATKKGGMMMPPNHP